MCSFHHLLSTSKSRISERNQSLIKPKLRLIQSLRTSLSSLSNIVGSAIPKSAEVSKATIPFLNILFTYFPPFSFHLPLRHLRSNRQALPESRHSQKHTHDQQPLSQCHRDKSSRSDSPSTQSSRSRCSGNIRDSG